MQNKYIENVLEIQGYFLKEILKEKNKVYLHLEKAAASYVCSRCGQASFIHYDKYPVTVEDLPAWGKRTFLCFDKHRLSCSNCQKVVTERLDFVEPHRRHAIRFEQFVGALCKQMCLSAVCRLTGLHWDTVKQIDKKYIQTRLQEIDWAQVQEISIDEVSYRKRHRYFTIISDRKTRRIIQIIESRKGKEIAKFFRSLDKKVRAQIRLVTMDMWRAYRKVVLKYLPHAMIVYDKFHVISHLNKAIDQVRIAEQKRLQKEGYVLLKRSRWLLLRGKESLTEEQREHLQTLCRQNDTLYRCYLLKEEFRYILNYLRGTEGKTRLAKWIQEVKDSGIEPLIKFTSMVLRWYHGIITYFSHPVTNSLAEGLNNVIATVIKRGYGFRDLEYLKLKIMQQQITYFYPH